MARQIARLTNRPQRRVASSIGATRIMPSMPITSITPAAVTISRPVMGIGGEP